jgi:hypothetical protein
MNDEIIKTKTLENIVSYLNRRSRKRYGLMTSEDGYLLVKTPNRNEKDIKDDVHRIAFGRTRADLFLKICAILEFLNSEES